MKSVTHKSLALIAVLMLALAGCQQDATLEAMDYNPEDDVYLMIGGQVVEDATSILPIGLVGEIAFDLQEGTHERIRDVSGARVNYYYIWVCLADACIPVDPVRFSR